MTARFDVRVYFEDTDFSGRVYHGAFVRFLERGRTEMLRGSGIDHMALARREPPLFFTLRHLALTFRAPAFIDDLLTVETECAHERHAVFQLSQRVVREGIAIVEGRVELCLVHHDGRPARPPQAVRAALVS